MTAKSHIFDMVLPSGESYYFNKRNFIVWRVEEVCGHHLNVTVDRGGRARFEVDGDQEDFDDTLSPQTRTRILLWAFRAWRSLVQDLEDIRTSANQNVRKNYCTPWCRINGDDGLFDRRNSAVAKAGFVTTGFDISKLEAELEFDLNYYQQQATKRNKDRSLQEKQEK